jgi:hypothetical protein
MSDTKTEKALKDIASHLKDMNRQLMAINKGIEHISDKLDAQMRCTNELVEPLPEESAEVGIIYADNKAYNENGEEIELNDETLENVGSLCEHCILEPMCENVPDKCGNKLVLKEASKDE